MILTIVSIRNRFLKSSSWELFWVLIYDRIKETAKLRKFKLTGIKEVTGISFFTIKNWNGTDPSVGNLLTIARFFDVSVDYLIGNTDDPQSHKSGPDRALLALKEVRETLNQKIETIEHQSGRQPSGEDLPI